MRCMVFDRLAGPAAYLIEYNAVGILEVHFTDCFRIHSATKNSLHHVREIGMESFDEALLYHGR